METVKQILFLLLFIPYATGAQTQGTIEDKVKNLKSYSGFLNFYWDEKSGKIFLEIDKLDSAMLYQTSLPAGLGSNDLGLDRGKIGSTAIIKFNRVGNKVLMIQPNYAFRAV